MLKVLNNPPPKKMHFGWFGELAYKIRKQWIKVIPDIHNQVKSRYENPKMKENMDVYNMTLCSNERQFKGSC